MIPLTKLSAIFLISIIALLPQYCESVNQQNLNAQLTVEDLVNSRWKFGYSLALLGLMRFSRDGKILQYDHFNERFWKLQNDSFTILNGNNQPYSKYFIWWRDHFGKWHIRGYTMDGRYEFFLIQI